MRTEIKSKFKNTTTLIVAQRIGTIKNADCIFVLDNGQIHAAGTHDELYKKSDLYRNICLSQLDEKELVL